MTQEDQAATEVQENGREMCIREEGAAKGVKRCLGRKARQPKELCDKNNIFKH